MYKIVKVTNNNRQELSSQLRQLKKSSIYPLGSREFYIDHGEDYFGYYENIGEMHYWCVLDGSKVIGSICGVITQLSDGQKAYYVCDLKVVSGYTGRGLARKLFRKVFFYMLFRRGIYRAYAILMNSDDPEQSGASYKKVVYINHNIVTEKDELRIYLLTKRFYVDNLKYFKDYYLVNTTGLKDVVFTCSGKINSLYHLSNQRPTNHDTVVPKDILDTSVITIAVCKDCSLDNILIEKGVSYNGSARLMSNFSKKGTLEITTDRF